MKTKVAMVVVVALLLGGCARDEEATEWTADEVIEAVWFPRPDYVWAANAPDITLEPVEVETIACVFDGRTLVADGENILVTTRGVPAQADASPQSIIVEQDSTGSQVTMRINPDQGCVTSGCRNGNYYQIRCQGTADDGAMPTGNVLLQVKKVVLAP